MRKQVVISIALYISASMASAAVPQKINAFPEGERLIYTKLVSAYRANNAQDLVEQRQLLERHFPNSIHLDNAYYLNAMIDFQNGRMGESIKSFNTVTDRFKKSNKRPSALFGLAVAYDRLNLKPQAIRVWKMILKEYPGSPESKRAQMHLRMAALKDTKKK